MKHLAIIADGNRRWAKNNGFPKEVGHAQGLVTIEKTCEWAINNKIKYLTFYCFSTENWGRPQNEVDNIMDLARHYFKERKEWYIQNNIKVRFAGRRNKLDKDIVDSMMIIEQDTRNCSSLTLTICVDYGGRDEIIQAIENGARTEQEITNYLYSEIPEPEMILRTGGHQRLSNFMIWGASYSELYFLDIMFPDLNKDYLDKSLQWYEQQERNFGI